MACVWGCAETQRNYYQAPPAQPAGIALTHAEPQNLESLVVTGLASEGYDFEPTEAAAGLVHGEVRDDKGAAGRLIAVAYEPQSPGQVAIEVRMGTFGNPARERRLAEAVAAQSGSARTLAGSPARNGRRWSEAPLAGRWIDLEEAVPRAGSTKKSVDMAVVSVDRWRYATFFDLRTLAGEEVRLIVIGDRQSAAGPQRAFLRIGLFGDPEREGELLKRLRSELAELARAERLPGAR